LHLLPLLLLLHLWLQPLAGWKLLGLLLLNLRILQEMVLILLDFGLILLDFGLILRGLGPIGAIVANF